MTNFVPGKRKYLICVDQQGHKLLSPIIENLVENNHSFELIFIGGNTQETNLKKWLAEQRMGSYLYAALNWEQLRILKKLAYEACYSEEESQFIGYGTQSINVFCCRCHGMTPVEVEEISGFVNAEIMCDHCRLLLSVSDHYSSLREAYLGYVAKI